MTTITMTTTTTTTNSNTLWTWLKSPIHYIGHCMLSCQKMYRFVWKTNTIKFDTVSSSLIVSQHINQNRNLSDVFLMLEWLQWCSVSHTYPEPIPCTSLPDGSKVNNTHMWRSSKYVPVYHGWPVVSGPCRAVSVPFQHLWITHPPPLMTHVTIVTTMVVMYT